MHRVLDLQDQKALEICFTIMWTYLTLLNCILTLVKNADFIHFFTTHKKIVNNNGLKFGEYNNSSSMVNMIINWPLDRKTLVFSSSHRHHFKVLGALVFLVPKLYSSTHKMAIAAKNYMDTITNTSKWKQFKSSILTYLRSEAELGSKYETVLSAIK